MKTGYINTQALSEYLRSRYEDAEQEGDDQDAEYILTEIYEVLDVAWDEEGWR